MPKGFVKLTRVFNAKVVRVNINAIGWYLQHPTMPHTVVTLNTRSEGDSEILEVRETEAEIEALIEAAQGETPKSEFAQAMGGAMVGAFGGAR